MLGGIMGMMGGPGPMGFRFVDMSPSHSAMGVDLKGVDEAMTGMVVDADSHFDGSLLGTQEDHALTDYYLI